MLPSTCRVALVALFEVYVEKIYCVYGCHCYYGEFDGGVVDVYRRLCKPPFAATVYVVLVGSPH